jgi:trehalose 6-phosphate phosphatase
MQALFSDKGEARLNDIVHPGILCAFDFDGTLAPITSEPAAARLPPEVLERLLQLSSLTPIAVLTGRSLADIRARLGFDPPFVVGNHGVEGMADAADLERHAACCRGWRRQLEIMLADHPELGSGIHTEDKRFSLSLHYRAAPDQAAAAETLRSLAARLDPLPRVVTGKCVFNLLPPDSYDKGRALVELLRRSGAQHAIYVGDDVTDEDVFRLKHDEVLSVRVEPVADSAADFFIPTHPDIVRLLDELIVRLSLAQKGKAGQLAGPRRA